MENQPSKKRKAKEVENQPSKRLKIKEVENIYLLLNLPEDVLEKILLLVSDSAINMCSLKIASKTFNNLAKKPLFLSSIDVTRMRVPFPNNPGFKQFLENCVEARNPRVLYWKGCLDYIEEGKKEGEVLIKAAANLGHERAIYVYSMLSLGVNKNKEDVKAYAAKLSLQNVRKISEEMEKEVSPFWEIESRNKEYLDMARTYTNNSLYECDCSPISIWAPWYHHDFKDENMCTTCFWNLQLGRFFRFFRGSIRREIGIVSWGASWGRRKDSVEFCKYVYFFV